VTVPGTTAAEDTTGGSKPPWPAAMDNPIRHYDWGSTSVLAGLQGRSPGEAPEAELWMGAHPVAPSFLVTDTGRVSLAEAIERDPAGILGRECLERFGPRLPFLLKVLAIERGLSIQVHPTPAQAAAGHAREEAAGIPSSDPHRVYVDPFAKPELLYAATTVEAMAGLRDPGRAAHLVGLLDAPRLGDVAARLRADADVVGALTGLVAWPSEDRPALVAEVLAAVPAALAGAEATGDADAVSALRWVVRLAEQHPADPLVVGPLILGLHRLERGSTLFLDAGIPHAYLSGVGVEIMASSDNVVRAGLTSKHVDSAALLDLLDPVAAPRLDLPALPLGGDEVAYRPPVADFQLTRTVLGSGGEAGIVTLSPIPGPQVLLCLDGRVQVSAGGRPVALTAGRSAFLGAGAPPPVLRGVGEVFRAAPGLSS